MIKRPQSGVGVLQALADLPDHQAVQLRCSLRVILAKLSQLFAGWEQTYPLCQVSR